jgi:hypothetical protein
MRSVFLSSILALTLAFGALADKGSGNSGSGNSGSGNSGSSNSGSGGSGSGGGSPSDDNKPDDRPPDNSQNGSSGSSAAAQLTRTRINLTATPAGLGILAKGHAEIRARGPQQRFKVEVEALAADGTTFEIRVDGKPIGTITTLLGEGQIEFETNNGRTLPAGLNPVTSIRRVTALNAAGVVILEGSF